MAITANREPAHQPAVRALLEQSWALSDSLYPAESNHHLDETELRRPDISFFVARLDGQAVGCGALKRVDAAYGEVKSLFVDAAVRGRGIARLLLGAIEAEARAQGLTLLRLETGIRQPEAVGLYEAAGFRRIGPFGDYREDPLSLFMEKAV
ncbi:MAG TPA: GNAT family N-acetyltransferase [Acidisoma sp.]|jgi:putative acetyltransferase|nr:GNAT family N-acetyltransferase [Acidisoma sp.]